MKRLLIILTSLTALGGSDPLLPSRIDAPTGEIEVVRHKSWQLSIWEDYTRQSVHQKVIALKQTAVPDEDSLFGVIGPGHFATAVVRHVADPDSTELLIDVDGDGALDGPARKLPRVGTSEYVTVKNEVTGGVGENRRSTHMAARLRFDPGAPPDPQPALVEDWLLRRTGRLRVGTLDVAFRLDGYRGLFARGSACLDLNGNGDFTTEECFGHSKRDVELAGRNYSLEVAEDGSLLTLRSDDVSVPRPTLLPGSPAPDFEFQDVDGTTGRLTEYRGHFVLLDFWGTWCSPCVADLPKLRALNERFRDKGLKLLGINVADPSGVLSEFIKVNELTWRHVPSESTGGALQLYDVGSFPTYFLIAPDGSIAARPSRDDLVDVIADAMH